MADDFYTPPPDLLVIGSQAMVAFRPELRKKFEESGRLLDRDYIASLPAIKQHIQNYIDSGYDVKATIIDDGNKLVAKCSKKSNGELIINEYEIAHPGSNQELLLKIIHESIEEDSNCWPVDRQDLTFWSPGLDAMIAGNDLLLMLKQSHRYKKNTPFFKKTMEDILYLRSRGASFIPQLQDWYKQREKETYTYNHPNLNQGKDSFFNKDESFYVYDHDTIHMAVKHLDKPAYEYYKPSENEVNCSKDLFDAAPDVVKLYGVLEESYVLALERSLIPNNFKIDPTKAFDMALEKVCTSITSGWFREFAWEHYHQVYNLYHPSYVDKFKVALAEGKVKPFSGNNY